MEEGILMKVHFANYALSNAIDGLIHVLKINVNEETGEIVDRETVCKSVRMRNAPYYSQYPFDLSHVTCERCYKSYVKHYK